MFRDPEHIEKAYGMGGMPAHNGTQAALMVAHGFTGVEDMFSGERDFFFTFAQDGNRAELTRGLGRDYEILRGGIKRWPVGGPIQGPLHVLRDLMHEHHFAAEDVEELVARLPDKELEIVNNRDMPDISVQHLLAVMLRDGTVTFASAHDFRRMRDPRVLALRKRIKAVGDPSLTDAQRRWRCVMPARSLLSNSGNRRSCADCCPREPFPIRRFCLRRVCRLRHQVRSRRRLRPAKRHRYRVSRRRLNRPRTVRVRRRRSRPSRSRKRRKRRRRRSRRGLSRWFRDVASPDASLRFLRSPALPIDLT